jgi:F-type H+-transporting ATPase subunit epsilon
MKTVQVDVVTPERTVYGGEARMVIARGVEGEIGVLPGHAPLVTPLKISTLLIKEESGDRQIAVSGGFLEVRPDKVTILAETAELPEEIDVKRAKQAIERAQQQLTGLSKGDLSISVLEQAIARAKNRLKVAGELVE